MLQGVYATPCETRQVVTQHPGAVDDGAEAGYRGERTLQCYCIHRLYSEK
jgi:hypothetical protein